MWHGTIFLSPMEFRWIWDVSKLRCQGLNCCMHQTRSAKFVSMPCLGTCDCDWWVPLSMWDNADKRSNLICPVGSCILLAICTHFLMCGTLHCTHMMVYLVLPNCSLFTAGWSLLFVMRNVCHVNCQYCQYYNFGWNGMYELCVVALGLFINATTKCMLCLSCICIYI